MTEDKLQLTYQKDQAASVNSYIDVDVDGEKFHLLLTTRAGADEELIVLTATRHIHALRTIRAISPRPENTVPMPTGSPQSENAGNSEPSYVPIDESGKDLPEIKTFTAETLDVSMNNNKYYYKVKGKPFTQYGVTVWPEVLEAAKLDVTPGQPVPDIHGWRADYQLKDKDGKKVPEKVIRLLPPK